MYKHIKPIIMFSLLLCTVLIILKPKPGHAKAYETFLPLIEAASHETGIPEIILMALAKRESNWDPKAKSEKGAIGLLQVKPSTAKDMGIDPEELFDPYTNFIAGARYLKWLHQKFGDWGTTFAAYFIGPGRIERNSLNSSDWEKINTYLKGIQKYVRVYQERRNI